MKDIKKVLLFFSFSMASFLVYLSLNLFYFFAIIGVTISIFVMGYMSQVQWLFPAYLVVALPLIFWGFQVFFLKKRLALNVDYIRFLDRLEKVGSDGIMSNSTDSAKVELPQDLKKLFKEIKAKVKKEGIKYISPKLAIALAAVHIGEQQTQPMQQAQQTQPMQPQLSVESYNAETIRRWKYDSLRLFLLEILAFLILFIPFGLISLIFTMGLDNMVKQLIYVMGFFFAWFLHSSIVTPIAGLILQGTPLRGEPINNPETLPTNDTN